MATLVAPSGSAASTSGQRTVRQIYAGSELGELSVDLLFIHELNGGKGNGHVPQDTAKRGAYYEMVRRHLRTKYHLTAEELAQLQHQYRQNNGPGNVRTKLEARLSMKTDKVSTT